MKLTEEQFRQCQRIFLELGQEGLYMSHYELAEQTLIGDPQVWKNYLMDPRTVDYISSEMTVVRNATMNKMVSNAADSNSVGQSQLLNALSKIDEKAAHKEGPAFIYCYVPLNDKQKEAPNIRKVDHEGVEIVGENEYIIRS